MDDIEKTLQALDNLAKTKKEEGLRQRDIILKEQKFLRERALRAVKKTALIFPS